jgi:hypothetical protein
LARVAAGHVDGEIVLEKERMMADPVPVGSDVSAGTYECTNCGYELGVQSVQSLPPCPKCDGPYSWNTLTGGDAREDPFPQDD